MDKATLLKNRTAEREVEIEGVGTVRIRALTRREALQLQGKEMPIEEMERKMLAFSMVDPVLTEDEVRQWQEASPVGEIQVVSEAIAELSGMDLTAAKDAYKSAGE